MNTNIVRYQITIFGEFTSIQPDVETIQRLTNNLKEFNFLPQFFQENNIKIENLDSNGKIMEEVVKPQFSSVKRLRLVSVDDKYSIDFSTETILIQINKINDGLSEELESISKIVSASLGGLLGSRIGLTIFFQTTCVSKKVKPLLEYYGKLDEFSLNLNRRKKLMINTFNQTTNVILNIDQPFDFDGKMKKTERVNCVVDINTAPEDDKLRFSPENVIAFLSKADEESTIVLSELQGE